MADMQSLGWGVLAEMPGREVIVGAVTKPWEANVSFRALPPDQFAAFDEPGYVKIILTIRADPIGATDSIFRTETRAIATDRTSRVRFRRYWSFLSPGIIVIRWAVLGLVKDDAERRARKGSFRSGRPKDSMNPERTMKRRMAIIGTGWVGSSVAISTLLRAWPTIAPVRRARSGRRGRSHGSGPRRGLLSALRRPDALSRDDEADIVVIAAGRGGRPGESTAGPAARKRRIVRDIGGRSGARGTILVVTNPVDVLTQW